MNKREFGFFLKEVKTLWPRFGEWYSDQARTESRRRHFELVFKDLDLDACKSALKIWFQSEPALQPMDYDDFPVTMKAKHATIQDRRAKNIRSVRQANRGSNTFVGTSGPCMSAALLACANVKDDAERRKIISDVLDDSECG